MATEVVEGMKSLSEDGIGHYIELTEKEKVYYKPLPVEDNEAKIGKYVDYVQYKERFSMATDAKFFSTAQHRRLLTKSPDKDILMQEYGYM